MPPKRGKQPRRTSNGWSAPTTHGGTATAPPPPLDRTTWPGWVEMESEPAFFNTMLADLGVQGLKLYDVVSLDTLSLLTLPQPVHALIFLFRYQDSDADAHSAGSACPKDLWFANQTPDFACATFALLNVVFNVPGLAVGEELRKFRERTMGLGPVERGEAVDRFDLVKRVHNSFATENDLLVADMHLRDRHARFVKRQAALKANATKAAKKAELANGLTSTAKFAPAPARSTPRKSPKERKVIDSSADDEYESPKKKLKTGLSTEAVESSDRRRSARAPKPRRNLSGPSPPADVSADDNDDSGFHFIAYMPIHGRLWKLDGLDRFPQDMGPISNDTAWMLEVQALLQARMMQYAESDIQYNLMAVVHDSLSEDKVELLRNVRSLQPLHRVLDEVCPDWRDMEGAETPPETITGPSAEFGISVKDLESVEPLMEVTDAGRDPSRLLALRRSLLSRQGILRGSVRDGQAAAKRDRTAAMHRRHDYGTFVRSWLEELHARERLGSLVDGDAVQAHVEEQKGDASRSSRQSSGLADPPADLEDCEARSINESFAGSAKAFI